MNEQKMWRTLIRAIDRIDFRSGKSYFRVMIPSWSEYHVHIPVENVPEHIHSLLATFDSRLHAKVNIGAEHWSDLVFEDWEES